MNFEWIVNLIIILPAQAWGGKGNINVVELFRLATALPNDWGLKLLNCCMKSEHSIKATSAKWRSHNIWFFWSHQSSENYNMLILKITLWFQKKTYLESPSSFLIRTSQIYPTRITFWAFLMIMMIVIHSWSIWNTYT